MPTDEPDRIWDMPASKITMRSKFAIWIAISALACSLLGSLVVVVYVNKRDQDAKDARVSICVDYRTLLSNVVLRTLNATINDYKRDPEKVLDTYRLVLSGIKAYKDDPDVIELAVTNTRTILSLSDPDTCDDDGGLLRPGG